MKFIIEKRPAQLRISHRVANRIVVICLTLLSLMGGQNTIAAAPTEYQLKGAFLFNFAKFIDWPAAAFANNQSPLTLCILGRDPFGRDLDETVQGQSMGNRAFSVRRIGQAPRDHSCQILFVSLSESSRFEQIVNAVRNLPILTVGEDQEFIRASGMIGFVVEDNKIRFEINLDVAERAGIKLSSKLLKLAKTVHERSQN